MLRHLLIALSMPKESTSIFKRLSASRSLFSHWIIVRSTIDAFSIGAKCERGPWLNTNPPTCCERCRGKPMSSSANSISKLTLNLPLFTLQSRSFSSRLEPFQQIDLETLSSKSFSKLSTLPISRIDLGRLPLCPVTNIRQSLRQILYLDTKCLVGVQT